MRADEAIAAMRAYGARLYARGLVAGSSGNLSRLLEDGTLLATASGTSLGDLGPGDFARCAGDGTPLEAGSRPTSELPLHVAAYRARDDVRCVVHTHPTHCTAWSKTGRLFPLDTVGAMESLGPIELLPYAPSGSLALADRCARAFARGVDTVVMARHGLSSVAADFETAYLRTDLAEQTAQIEFAATLLRASNVRGMPMQRPDVPYDELRSAADHPDAHAALDAFHDEYHRDAPDRAKLDAHAARVGGFAALAAPFERWWMNPRVQEFVAEVGGTGL